MQTYTFLKYRQALAYISSIIFVLNAGHLQAETLQHWLNETVDNHPSVLSAEFSLDAAGFKLIAADKALYNPELELDTESIEDVNTTTVGISQTIDWGDLRGANTQFAKSNHRVLHYSYLSKQRQVAQDALTQLGDFHTAKALKELAQQRRDLMQHFEELTRQRFNYGDLAQVDVDLAKLSHIQARFQLASARSEEVRAKQHLQIMRGLSNNILPPMPVVFPDPIVGAQKVDNIVLQTAELLKATAMVKSAQDNIKVQLAQGAATPTVALRAGREESDHVLGMTFSIPLKIRNNFKAEVDIANVEMIQAEREAMTIHRKLTSKLEMATASYALSREAWMFWEKVGAETLNEQLVLLERLWKAGELSTTVYLLQLTQALETESRAIEQRGKLWSDWSEWLLATGKIKHWLSVKGGI